MVGWYVRWAPRVYWPLFVLFIVASALMRSWGLLVILMLALALNSALYLAARRWHREAGG